MELLAQVQTYALKFCALGGSAIRRILLFLIVFYQRAISPLLGPSCRFHPSCSCYAAESLRKHGLFVGIGRSAWRLLRCHPFSRGGYDPP